MKTILQNKKKILFLIILLLGISVQMFAQTKADVEKIMNTCLLKKSLLSDLQLKSKANQTFTLKSNTIDLSGYKASLAKSLNINPSFSTKEEVTAKKLENYFEWIFDFSSDKLVHVIIIKHEKDVKNTPLTFRLEKMENNWVVQEKQQNN